MNKFTNTVLGSLVISIVGVLGVDYFSHLLLSNPMETGAYFLIKLTWFFIFSVVFLSVTNSEKRNFIKVLGAGILVSLIWGAYYNVLPVLFDFYPFGIPLEGLSFLGMGLLGTGLAFGTVHTLAFVFGYYAVKYSIIKK